MNRNIQDGFTEAGLGRLFRALSAQPSHMDPAGLAFSPSCKNLLQVCTPYIEGPQFLCKTPYFCQAEAFHVSSLLKAIELLRFI